MCVRNRLPCLPSNVVVGGAQSKGRFSGHIEDGGKQMGYRQTRLTVCLTLFALGFAIGGTALGSNYIIVSDSGRYFQFEDGTDFLPLGFDQMPDFPESLYKVYPINNLMYDKEALREYFNKMHDHGVTVLRVWGEAPDYDYRYLLLENPVGVFNPAFARFFDDVFELAKDYKIYIMLTPYDTYWQHYRWSYYPYNYANGGPCHSESEGLTTDKCFEYQKARMKWFVDRYGNSDYLFSWDIMNEINWAWDVPDESTIRAWVDRMSSWLIQYERQKWGKNHIITVSTSYTPTWGDLRYVVFQHPNIDFATTHMYEDVIASPPDVIAPAVSVNTTVKSVLNQFVSGDMRPYFDSESGPINGELEESFDNEYYHNMIWAHLASGGAGSNLRWPFRLFVGPSEGMFDSVLGMSRIIKHIKWSRFASVNIDDNVNVTDTGGHTVIGMACGDSYTAIVFVLQDSRVSTGIISGANLSVASMTPGTYLVKYFDSYTGDLISSEHVEAVSGNVNVTLSDFDKDIVIILVNQTASAVINRKPDAWLTSPAAGTGTGRVNSIMLSADAACTNDAIVDYVQFWANYHDGSSKDWRLLNTDYTAPYSYEWNISSFPDQTTVEFRVDVYDSKGVSRTSAMGLFNKGGITLERSGGDVTAGYGSIEFPPVNATIKTSKIATLKARAWDISSGVNRVKFWIQGTPSNPSGTNTLLGEVSSPTSGLYILDVNLSGYVNSTRWISVDVVDNNNNTVATADLHSGIVLASSPTDTTKPTGILTTPVAGDVITSGPVTVSADAFDAGSGVDHVAFWYNHDGGWYYLGSDSTAPYSIQWSGVLGSSQKLQFTADVFDKAGNSVAPASLVGGIFYEAAAAGDTFTPWSHIYSPDVYTSVWPLVTLRAIAGDRGSSGVKKVTFKYYLDGQWHTIGSDSNEPYEYIWDPNGIAHGSVVQIGVDVEDMAGNMVSSADIHSNVRVNSAADISRDEIVDYEDLAILAEQWLQTLRTLSADIAPPPAGDGIVNFLDFASFANKWLAGF
jgi:mannan endo-1,4-beta-mannosidase